MNDKELYYGFDSERQKQYEEDLVRDGVVSQEQMDSYQNKIRQWSNEDKQRFVQEGKALNQALISAMQNQLKPMSNEVQAIIREHHAWVGWNPTKEKYIALSKLYHTPGFKGFYDGQHPYLLEFITEAMKVFAEQELK